MTKSDVLQPVRVRYWAAVAHAAGTDADQVEITGPVTLVDLSRIIVGLHPEGRFAEVLGTCSILIGDRPASSSDPSAVIVQPGDSVEFLPPFAGG